MGDRFAVRMLIGGDLTEDKVPELVDILKELNPYIADDMGDMSDTFEDLEDALDWLKRQDSKCLEVHDHEGLWDEGEHAAGCVANLGLSYDYSCEALHEYPGVLDIHRPGEELLQIRLDSGNNEVALICDIRKILLSYVVSQAEMCRVLDRLAPETTVPMDKFRIVP